MADRRLQVFHAVAKHLSFTKAAEALFMSQPAVTFQVKQFEEQLQTRLFDMITIQMQVAKGVDEDARLQSTNLSDHQSEERVGSDIEGHAQKQVRAALVQLAT